MLIAALPTAPQRLTLSMREISTLGGGEKVTGSDGQPAQGRIVLLIGENVWGMWEIIAETATDENGDYAFIIPASPSDRFIVVGVGDAAQEERTVALGNLTGAL